MAGIGGITPTRRDLSRRRDRQASWILVVATAVAALIFYPLALLLAAATAGYAYVAGERLAALVALVLLVLAVVGLALDGLGDGLAV